MNIFPENTNKGLKITGYVIISLSIIVSISKGVLDMIINGLFWWFIFWVIAKIFQKKQKEKLDKVDIEKIKEKK